MVFWCGVRWVEPVGNGVNQEIGTLASQGQTSRVPRQIPGVTPTSTQSDTNRRRRAQSSAVPPRPHLQREEHGRHKDAKRGYHQEHEVGQEVA